jgi:hypothetical protein
MPSGLNSESSKYSAIVHCVITYLLFVKMGIIIIIIIIIIIVVVVYRVAQSL